jgi:2-methylcitrate dehydratase PrpD
MDAPAPISDARATARSKSITGELAAYIAEIPQSGIPRDASDLAKLFVNDTLAVAWAGSDAPGCREVHDLCREESGRPDATAWAFGGRLPAAAAALINSTTSAALDYDTIARDVPVHVNITVVPAAMAIAERQHASGAEFVAALVIGSDIQSRLAQSFTLPHRGWSYTSILGGFGAAAACARLLCLDPAQTQHALGLAFIQASGTQQANIEPSLTKRMLSAFAARAGVTAALLAQRGITAPTEVIEGNFGLHRLYQPGAPGKLLDGLGSRFESVNLSIKRYPSCGCNHTAIEAMLQLVRKHDLKPTDVRAIEARISPFVDRIVGMPYDPSHDPQVAAQFSILYSLACALVRRRLGLAEITAEAARDPAIIAEIKKIRVVVEPTWTGDRGPIELTVHTVAGGVYKTCVEHVPGSRESPLSESEIRNKLDECYGLGIRPLDAISKRNLIGRIERLEQIADMSKLFDGIA